MYLCVFKPKNGAMLSNKRMNKSLFSIHNLHTVMQFYEHDLRFYKLLIKSKMVSFQIFNCKAIKRVFYVTRYITDIITERLQPNINQYKRL